MLEVKSQGHTLVQVCGGEDIDVDAGALKPILWFSLCFLLWFCTADYAG